MPGKELIGRQRSLIAITAALAAGALTLTACGSRDGGKSADSGNGGGTTITLVEMSNVFAISPNFAFTTVNVNAYADTPRPRQPGGLMGSGANLGTRFYFSDLRTVAGVTHLVSSDPVGANGGVEARWYDLNITNPASPAVLQQGNISRGNDSNGFHIDT